MLRGQGILSSDQEYPHGLDEESFPSSGDAQQPRAPFGERVPSRSPAAEARSHCFLPAPFGKVSCGDSRWVVACILWAQKLGMPSA